MKDLILGIILLIYDLLEDFFKFIINSINVTRKNNPVKIFIKKYNIWIIVILSYIVFNYLNFYMIGFFACIISILFCAFLLQIFRDDFFDEELMALIILFFMIFAQVVVSYSIRTYNYKKVGVIYIPKNAEFVKINVKNKVYNISVHNCKSGNQILFKQTSPRKLFINFGVDYKVKCGGDMETYTKIKDL